MIIMIIIIIKIMVIMMMISIIIMIIVIFIDCKFSLTKYHMCRLKREQKREKYEFMVMT